MAPTHHTGDTGNLAYLQQYAESVVLPLLDGVDRSQAQMSVRRSSHEVEVEVQVGTIRGYSCLVGRGGRTADSVEHLLRAWTGANKVRGRMRYRVVPVGEAAATIERG